MLVIKQKPDTFGSLASALCLIHCIATPFLFISQTCALTGCSETPIWWQFIDYLFLAISFVAIYWTTHTTTINWIKPLMWLSWLALFTVIINEKLKWLSIPETVIYIPAFALIATHIYNRKYCGCHKKSCCTNER